MINSNLIDFQKKFNLDNSFMEIVDSLFNKLVDFGYIGNSQKNRLIEKLNNKRLAFKEKRINKYNIQARQFEGNEDFKLIVKVNNEEQYITVKNKFNGMIITENYSLYNKFQNDLVYLNPRIQTKKIIDGGIQNYCLDHNILFTSNYSNIYNSDSLLFYHNLGVKDIGLSVELSSLEIKELLCSFKNKFNFCFVLWLKMFIFVN